MKNERCARGYMSLGIFNNSKLNNGYESYEMKSTMMNECKKNWNAPLTISFFYFQPKTQRPYANQDPGQ